MRQTRMDMKLAKMKDAMQRMGMHGTGCALSKGVAVAAFAEQCGAPRCELHGARNNKMDGNCLLSGDDLSQT